MQTPVQVTFHNLPGSPAVEDSCLDEVAKLERRYDRITSTHVTIAESHRRHRKGNLYEIRILLRVPGHQLVVNRSPAAHRAAEDIAVAVRESFDEARRVLDDHVRQKRGRSKRLVRRGRSPRP
jgi:ribosome-associated translation inhibitor RaiA